MMMRLWLIGLAALAACSDNGTSGSGFGVNASTCPFFAKQSGSGTSSAACGSCNSSNCGSTYSDCYGALFTGGSAGGKCAAYLACICACGATDLACAGGCASKQTADCMTCQTASGTCSTTNCASACKPTSSTDMAMSSSSNDLATSGGTTQCAMLAACCPKVPAGAMRTGCEGTVTNGNEMGCMYELQGEQAAGYC